MKKLWIFKLIGIVIFIWIISRLNWDSFRESIYAIDWRYVILYFIIFCMGYLFSLLRLQKLLQKQGVSQKFWNIYRMTVEPIFWGSITPGRLGELSKIIYLSKHGLSTQKALNLVIIERVFDLLILAVLCLVGVGYYLWLYLHSVKLIVYYILILMAVLLISWMFKKSLIAFVNKIFSGYKFFSFFEKHIYGFIKDFKLLWLIALSFAVLIQLAGLLHMFVLVKAFHFPISFVAISLAFAIASIVGMLPLSIGGLGMRELVYIITFTILGITWEHAVAFSLFSGIFLAYLMIFVLVMPIWLADFIQSMRYK